MPQYTYECSRCGETEDVFFHMREDRPRYLGCPVCAKPSMRRIYTTPQVLAFKPYTTPHITGEPVEVRSPEHERALCKAHNVERLMSTDTFKMNGKERRKKRALTFLNPLKEDYDQTQHELGIGKETTMDDLKGAKA